MALPDIQLVSISCRNGISIAHVSVEALEDFEQIESEISPELALTLEAIMREDPFPKNLQGDCTFHFIEPEETTRSPIKYVKVQIRKGRSRTVRKFEITRPLFFLLWNIFHFNTVPSKLPDKKRDH